MRTFTALILLAGLAAGCRATASGGMLVKDLEIEGTDAVRAGDLKKILETRESSWLPWGRKQFFDRTAFENDLKRIEAFYRNRGYPRARVSAVDIDPSDDQKSVSVAMTVTEGEPLTLASISWQGFDPVLPPGSLEAVQERAPLTIGEPRDRQQVIATRDAALAQLKENGYPRARVQAVEAQGPQTDEVALTFKAEPGPPSVFGEVSVEGVASVGEDVVRRQLAFTPGEPFRQSQLKETQRRLYRQELFQFVNVEARPEEAHGEAVPVRITVAEGEHRRLRLGVGYGSEEKARATFQWRHVNFFGGARTGTFESKWSTLERGVRAGFTQPYVFAGGLTFSAQAAQWWTAERAYDRRTSGGRASITRTWSRQPTEFDWPETTTLTGTYIGEYESYKVTDEALADPTLTDDLISLGLDPVTGRGHGTVSGLAMQFNNDTTRAPLDRKSGRVVSGRVEVAGGLLGGTFTYREVLLEGRHYLPAGNRFVWANRVRLGALDAASLDLIPFFKRYYLGGSTSVRGWGRYEIAPLSASGVPIPGRSLLEASSEARYEVTDSIGVVGFLDAGNVWSDGWNFDLGELRYSAGPGLRYLTPIGPIRVDLAYQLNPIEGLLIEGEPQGRRWRIHFSIGQAF